MNRLTTHFHHVFSWNGHRKCNFIYIWLFNTSWSKLRRINQQASYFSSLYKIWPLCDKSTSNVLRLVGRFLRWETVWINLNFCFRHLIGWTAQGFMDFVVLGCRSWFILVGYVHTNNWVEFEHSFYTWDESWKKPNYRMSKIDFPGVWDAKRVFFFFPDLHGKL